MQIFILSERKFRLLGIPRAKAKFCIKELYPRKSLTYSKDCQTVTVNQMALL